MQIKLSTTRSRMVLLMLGAASVGCWLWLLAGVVWNRVPRPGENSGAVASPSLRGTSGGDAVMGCALPPSCLIHAPGLPLKYFKDKMLKKTPNQNTKLNFLTQKGKPQKKQKNLPNNPKLMEMNVLV